MKRRPEERKPEKAKDPKYVPPRKPFRKQGRFAAAAALAALELARPGISEARGVSAPSKPPRTADTDKPEAPVTGISLGPSQGPVDTSIRYTRNEDGQRLLVIDYEDRSGRSAGPIVPLHDGMGSLLQEFPGAERTVLVFENSVIITIGYDATFRGEFLLKMDGGFRTSTSVEFQLPEDCRNGNLLSSAVVKDADGTEGILYFINRNGYVRARRTDRMNPPVATAWLPASGNAVLVGLTNGMALHFQPGEDAVTFLKADFGTESILTQERELPGVESPLTVVRRGMETIIITGGRRFLASETEPGDFSSLGLIQLPED
ncbi:MAG: hypothetical protein AB1657_04335 [Candidatus Micrarchaeota archaeon]